MAGCCSGLLISLVVCVVFWFLWICYSGGCRVGVCVLVVVGVTFDCCGLCLIASLLLGLI